MKNVIIPQLDYHIIHNCNLSCEGCSDFTNHNLPGKISIEEARKEYKFWNKRVFPKEFAILGGEPTLHKDLIEHLYLAREMWSYSRITLITNGFFLHRHKDLGKVLSETNIQIGFSLHDDSEEYMNKVQDNIDLCKSWEKDYGIVALINHCYKKWNLIYKGFGNDIMPYEDNDPEASWNNCFMDGKCFQLHDGKLWKCPPITYLPLLAKNYKISDKWDPYLKYKALDSDCSNKQLSEFLSRKSESVCAMCPSSKHYK